MHTALSQPTASTSSGPPQRSDRDKSCEPASHEQVLGQYIPLLYHYNMLQDEDRVNGFREAIDLLVRPGMHVVELGGGTGILSSFAARRGARVSCVERNPALVACAQKFVKTNGLDDRITVVHADASRYVPSAPVDVVVCEMLHVALLREHQAQVITAFKQNYTRRFGPRLPVFIPEASILMVQPVDQSFDFAGYHAAVPLFQPPLQNQPRTKELSTLSPYASISYADPIPLRFDVHQSLACSPEGNINALRFVTQNVLAIDMQRQRAITWPNQCLVLPIDAPVSVSRGEPVELAFSYAAGDTVEALSDSIRVSVSPSSPATLQLVDQAIASA
ncbi:MAG: methyltransferase domain-containing protein [Planctomycetaceae bacterium]